MKNKVVTKLLQVIAILMMVSLVSGCFNEKKSDNSEVGKETIAISKATALNSQVYVNSLSAFNSAQSAANAGDTIIWKNGAYSNVNLTVSKNGIVVKTETPGGVVFGGNSTVRISGSNITFDGFQYKGCTVGTGVNLMEVSGSHNKIHNININNIKCAKYIVVQGGTQYNDFYNCNIENKPTGYSDNNCLIQVTTTSNTPCYHSFRFCSFQNMSGGGGDFGNEPIRIGLSSQANNSARCIVEYCYFTKCTGADNETVSVKSSDNICRYNTFDKNPGAMMVFRHGNRNVAYGNFFINGSAGIRIKEGVNHSVYNNYFSTGSQSAVILTYVADGGPTTPTGLNNINFFHNTFYNCPSANLSSGIKNVMFANNLYQNTGIASGSGVTNIGNMTTSNLVLNSEGYYQIGAGSPAIDGAKDSYPAIVDLQGINDDPTLTMDISGKVRPSTKTLKDVGATEYNATGEKVNKPLTLNDVGPIYLRSTVNSKLDQTISFPAIAEKVVGDSEFSAGATASSGLAVTLESSNTGVAAIVGNTIKIIGVGTATITASQSGDSVYNKAQSVSQIITVKASNIIPKQNQTITFPQLAPKVVGDVDFNAGATASSGLPVTLTSSDTKVATIVGGNIRIVGEGKTVITASQAGNSVYKIADEVSQTLTVTAVITSIWSNGDIGSPSLKGSMTSSACTFTIKGAGNDVWNTSDQFHYVYKKLSGDGEIIAKVNSVSQTNTWAKAGLMIRESLSSKSKFAYIMQRPDKQVQFDIRSATGADAKHASTSQGGTSASKWLRIVRSGNLFKSYYSTSSAAGPWIELKNSQTITMASTVYIGMFVTSHNASSLCTASFSDVR